MSLILEALRRSEAERRRGQVPDLLAPGHVVRRRTRARWIVPMVALIVGMVLAAAVARWWWASPAVLSSPPAQAAPVLAVPPSAPPAPMPIERALPPATPAFESPQVISEPRTELAIVASDTRPVDSTPAAPSDASARGLDVAMLGPSERAALPPLRISMHVFHEDPARRFAIVDGQRLREGDVLVPGLRLLSIQRDGLQLEWQGRSLWLPR